MTSKILRKPEVLERIGVKKSTIYDWIGKGLFPRPINLGTRAVGWLESDVEAFIAKRVKESRGGPDA
ncbi:MAG: helix-turn-helix transcriptional regulator [Bdellovibrionales bacterium]